MTLKSKLVAGSDSVMSFICFPVLSARRLWKEEALKMSNISAWEVPLPPGGHSQCAEPGSESCAL